MPSHWLELSLEAGTEIQDLVVDFLAEKGSTGFVHTDRTLRAFFPSTENDARLKRDIRLYLRQLRGTLPESSAGRARWRIIADKDWGEAWRKYFKPQAIGKRFLVTPPWIEPRAADRQVIVVEPAMAFGTGTHATTRNCLELIDELCAAELPSSALDVGTGSGILAIALAKLGVSEVVALDNDPVALEAAEANLELNDVQGAVTLSSTDIRRIRKRFPLVVANIIMDTLIELAAPLSRAVSARGTLILSGLLRNQVPRVLPHFERFALHRQKDRQEWSTLLLRKVA